MEAPGSTTRPTTSMTLVSSVPGEILMHILVFLEPGDLLKYVAYTSKAFAEITQNDPLWVSKYSILKASPQTGGQSSLLTKKQNQQCCILAATRRNLSQSSQNDWLALKRDDSRSSVEMMHDMFLIPASVLPSFNDAASSKKRGSAMCLSSTQHRNEESLEKTLSRTNLLESIEDDDWETIASGNPLYKGCFPPHAYSCYWWSSSPCRVKDSDEVLLLTTKSCTETIFTEVAIKSLRDPHNERAVYSWPRIVIRIYNVPMVQNVINSAMSDINTRIVSDKREIINAVLSDHVPTYESAIITCNVKRKDDDWQFYEIPDGVVGTVITFTLMGKTAEQFPGNPTHEYYTCVERIAARGVPLLPE